MSMRPVFFVCLVACNGLSTELPESTNPSNTKPTLTTSSTPNTTTSSSSTSTTTTPTTTPTTDCVAGSAIQPAIDGASNGDTIYICAGTHPVNLSITRNVALDAESGQSVILDGGGSASTIAVDSGRSLTVRNLEITGGSGGSVAAGGIEASDAINLIVENTSIYGNTGLIGGIQAPYNGVTELSDVTLDSNVGDYAGGLSIGLGSLTRVDVTYNHATTQAGGVWVYPFQGPTIDDVSVADNSTDGHGGGIALDWSSYWTGGLIERNQAAYGGGVALLSAASTLLDDLTVRDNTATAAGGGFYNGLSIGGAMAVRNSTFSNNSAPLGGGLYVQQTTDGNSTAELSNLTVSGNASDQGGGAVFDGIAATIVDGSLGGNVASVAGGGFALLNGASIGVSTVDIGTGTAANVPDDVDIAGQSYDYDGLSTFDCDAVVCQ